jgi:hypothetical protein
MMAETSPTELQDWTTLVPWRRSRLRHAGFDAQLAGELAADMRYDLRAVLDLVARGCPPQLAARICRPLDTDPRHA